MICQQFVPCVHHGLRVYSLSRERELLFLTSLQGETTKHEDDSMTDEMCMELPTMGKVSLIRNTSSPCTLPCTQTVQGQATVMIGSSWSQMFVYLLNGHIITGQGLPT